MPISMDLDHITGPFRSVGRFQLTPITGIFERLGKWLQDRVKKADLLDQASRDFPVVNFYSDAVALWLDSIQKGALSPDGNPPGFGEQMQRAGSAFIDGLRRIPEAVGNERIIPEFLNTLARGVEAILESVIRWENPRPEMFDPKLRTASDLFGEAALAFRAFASSKLQLFQFLFLQAGPAYYVLTHSDGAAKDKEPEDSRALPDMADRVTRYLIAGILIVPQLGAFLCKLWDSLVIYVKAAAIEAFGKIEQKVAGLRVTLIDVFFVDFQDAMMTALGFVTAATFIITRLVGFWVDFGHEYGKTLLKDLARIGDDITSWLHKVIVWIEDFITFTGEGILNYDLAPLIWTILGGLPGFILTRIIDPPPMRVFDFVKAGAGTLIEIWIGSTMELLSMLDPLDIFGVQEFLAALGLVVGYLSTPAPTLGPDTARMSAPPSFPSIYDAWFKSSSFVTLTKSFEDIANNLPGQLSDLVNAASAGIMKAGYRFEEQAARGARGMSQKELATVTARSAQLASDVFDDEYTKGLRGRAAKSQGDAITAQFESWFALGGMMTLGKVIEGYVSTMLGVFREKEEKGEELTVLLTKTSPHILAKKAALARARMQKMTVDARGLALDDALVQKIADRFRAAIQDAQLAGKQQLADLAIAEVTV